MIRKILPVFLFACLLSNVAVAQDEFESAFKDENVFSANLGVTTIGEQTFIGFRVQPEFSVGKFGIGLDVPLLFSTQDGKIRTEEFNNGVGVLRMVRYLRYGQKKKDPVYVKLGDMTGEQIGFGALLGNYSNATSFERRKVGISADFLFKKIVGLEVLYSDLNFKGSQKLLALRPYYKPFTTTSIPIVNTLELGVSYVTDKDDYEEKTDSGSTSNTVFTRDGNNAFGVDLGAILLKNALLKLTLDTQYVMLHKNDALANDIALDKLTSTNRYVTDAVYDTGDGFSVGLEAQFRFIANVFHLNTRIERQWYGDNYIPQFYNFAYEINKDARLQELITAKKSQGIYARLGSEILSLVKIEGQLVLPDDLENSSRGAIVGLSLQTKEIAKIKVKGDYVKAQLNDLKDTFKFDSRSLANVLVTYKISQFMEAGVDYQWTFAQKEDGTFKAVSQIRPYVGINIKL